MSHTYVFLGDSITEANRFWLPDSKGLGNGYVSILQNRLSLSDPDAICINRGIDGFTVPAVLNSLKNSPLPEGIRMISLLIGINDIGVSLNTGVSLTQLDYAENYTTLLSQLTQTGAQVLCMGPFIFPHPQKYLNWIPSVYELESMMEEIAGSFHLPFLKLHDELNRHADPDHYEQITPDGIHLTSYGHQLLASLIQPYIAF